MENKSKSIVFIVIITLIFTVTACTLEKTNNSYYTQVTDFNEQGIASVCIGDKWGAINTNLETVIKPISDQPLKFNNGMAVIKQGDKSGLINNEGAFIIEPIYETINPIIAFQYETQYISATKDSKNCLYNKNGDLVLDLKYEDIMPIGDNVFAVKKDGLYGLINIERQMSSEFNYLSIDAVSNGMAIFIINEEQDYLYGYLNELGEEIIPAIYNSGTQFTSNYAYVTDKKNGKVIDVNGNVLSQGDFENIYQNIGEYALVSKDLKWGIINKNCEYIVDPKYNLIVPPFEAEDPIVVQNIGEGAGYIDLYGNIIVDLIYDQTYPFKNGYGEVKENNKYGMVDDMGNTILHTNYDKIKCTTINDVFILKNEGKTGLFKKSEIIFDIVYDDIKIFDNEGLAILIKNDIKILADLEGNIIKDNIAINDMHLGFSEGLLAVKSNDKWGFIDKAGEIIIPYTYDDVGDFLYGYAKVKTEKGWTYILNPLI